MAERPDSSPAVPPAGPPSATGHSSPAGQKAWGGVFSEPTDRRVEAFSESISFEQPHAYFGVIGSKRRWATTVDALRERGISAAQLAGVRAPMGLELNAETPEEIALSKIGRAHV